MMTSTKSCLPGYCPFPPPARRCSLAEVLRSMNMNMVFTSYMNSVTVHGYLSTLSHKGELQHRMCRAGTNTLVQQITYITLHMQASKTHYPQLTKWDPAQSHNNLQCLAPACVFNNLCKMHNCVAYINTTHKFFQCMQTKL